MRGQFRQTSGNSFPFRKLFITFFCHCKPSESVNLFYILIDNKYWKQYNFHYCQKIKYLRFYYKHRPIATSDTQIWGFCCIPLLHTAFQFESTVLHGCISKQWPIEQPKRKLCFWKSLKLVWKVKTLLLAVMPN